MRKTKNLSRVMSMILAFCLSVALLPAQAFAATTDDDPATWPAPDSHYTAPDKNPVYLMVDFTDEDNGGVAAAHRCLSGAELNPDIVKATASAGGRVKYTCDTCGSWAQINVPALTLSAFTLDPAYKTHMTTGVEFSGSAYTLAPVVTGVTDSSITIEVVDGMAYSIDGGVTWQTTGTFTGLTRDTTYEIKVKAVETACYKELEGPSTMQATEKTTVTFERFADQTVEYNGHAQTYTLPKSNPGIASMTITGYDGIATPPVTVGDYVVNIDFVAADGYMLPETLPAEHHHGYGLLH